MIKNFNEFTKTTNEMAVRIGNKTNPANDKMFNNDHYAKDVRNQIIKLINSPKAKELCKELEDVKDTLEYISKHDNKAANEIALIIRKFAQKQANLIFEDYPYASIFVYDPEGNLEMIDDIQWSCNWYTYADFFASANDGDEPDYDPEKVYFIPMCVTPEGYMNPCIDGSEFYSIEELIKFINSTKQLKFIYAGLERIINNGKVITDKFFELVNDYDLK